MSDIEAVQDAGQAAIIEAFRESIRPIALSLGITDLAGINSVEDLFKQWSNNTRDVSLFALLGMAAQAGAMTLDGSWAEVLEGAGGRKLEAITSKLVDAGAQFGELLINDPELQQAIIGLEIVQEVVIPIITTVTEIKQTVEEVLETIEPYIPYAEIIIRAVRMAFFPPEGQGFTNDAMKLALKELSKILRLLYADIKLWLMEQTFPVPEVLLGLTNGVLDPTAGLDQYADDWATSQGIPEEDINYQTDLGDLSAQGLTSWVFGQEPPTWAQNAASALDKIYSKYGVATFSWLNSALETELVEYESGKVQALALSGQQDQAPVFVRLSLSDINRYSKEILSLLEQISNSAYADTTMLKIGIDKLIADGIIADPGTLSYDEKLTEKGGDNLRKRFYDINNRINSFHNILKVLSGEIRFNITETIPIIDYFTDSFSTQRRYVDDAHTLIEDLDPETPLTDLYDDIDGFHPAILNLALKEGTPFEEIFFHPDYLNIVMDSEGIDGPPFLAGLWGENPTRDDKGNIVSWDLVDERATAISANANIVEGAKFNSNFIDESGSYVTNPLTTSTPGYNGYATEVYETALAELINFISDNDYGDWEDEDVDQIAFSCFNDQYEYPLTKILGSMATFKSTWDSHIDAGVFVLDSANATDYIIHTELEPVYRQTGPPETYTPGTELYASGNSFLQQFRAKNIPIFKKGSPNRVSVVCAVSFSGTLDVKYAALYSPYDVLNEIASTIERRATGRSTGRRTKAPKQEYPTYMYSGDYFPATNYSDVQMEIDLRMRRHFGSGGTEEIAIKGFEAAERLVSNPDLYIVKRSAISNVVVGDSLFFYGLNGTASSVIGYEVSQIEVYSIPTNIRVEVDALSETIANSALDHPATPCVVYKLTQMQLNVPGGGYSYDPFCYPFGDFVVQNQGASKIKWSSIYNMNRFLFRRGLPPKIGGKYSELTTISKRDTSSNLRIKSANVSALQKLLSASALSQYLKEVIMDLPLIETSAGSGVAVVTLKQGKDIFRMLSENAVLMSTLSVDGADVLLEYRGLWKAMSKALEQLDNEMFSAKHASTLDKLFGDQYIDETLGLTDVRPWVDLDPLSPLYVRIDLFSDIARYITLQLEGEEYPLRRVKDKEMVGDSRGLYYQRYLILNQRINKSSGELYQAGVLEKSKAVLDNNKTNLADKLAITKVGIDAIKAQYMQNLVFINNKFIDASKYDLIRKTIGDKCLLTCGFCPVKDSCNFYDERAVILSMIKEETYFSFYVKDNQLDLIASIEGPNWDQDAYKKLHNPYAEIDSYNPDGVIEKKVSSRTTGRSTGRSIERESASPSASSDTPVRLIDDLIGEIEEVIPEFIDELTNQPFDDMGWITKARYGSVEIKDSSNIIASEKEQDPILTASKFMYDALFFEDTETYFEYGVSRTRRIGSYRVRFKVANAFKAFNAEDEMFLACDDGPDPIYLGKLTDLGLDIQNPQVSRHYAQACINMMDIENQNQAWMESYEIRGTKYTGRLRSTVKTELIGDGSYTIDSIIAGKPIMRKYINFMREVRIPLDNVKWALSGKANDIIRVKSTLPEFKTNVRLVAVQGDLLSLQPARSRNPGKILGGGTA